MLYLASRSPRRRALLDQLGVSFSVLDVDVVEAPESAEMPVDYVRRVAREKAQVGWEALEPAAREEALVLAADTEVVLDGQIFGKPEDADHAARMLSSLSGRAHQVICAVWVRSASREHEAMCISRVHVASLDPARIAAYVATGEPFGKAGAYAIQGKGGTLIEYLEGSYSGVVGLPLWETATLLRRFDLDV